MKDTLFAFLNIICCPCYISLFMCCELFDPLDVEIKTEEVDLEIKKN